MKKIIFTCPRDETEKLRFAVWNAWAWVNWNYSFCSIVSEITGYFQANSWAHPAIWKIWNIEEILEHKVEFICENHEIAKIIQTLKEKHSYETPHIEIYDVNLV